MKLSDHLGKGIWGIADKALPVAYGLGFVILVIRVLPEVEFGIFVLIQEIFLIVSGLATGFALQPMLKFASELRDDRRSIVSMALLLNLAFIILCSILAVAAKGPVGFLLNSAKLGELMIYMPALLFASFIRNFSLVLLQTRFLMQRIFWIDAVHFLGAVVLIAVFSHFGLFDSAFDLIIINLISLSASSLLGLVLSWSYIEIDWKIKPVYMRMLWDYGKFSLGGILSYLVYSKCDSFFLSAFAGPAQVGVYNAVKVFVRIFDTVAQVLQMFLVPATSRLSAQGDFVSLKTLTEKAVAFSSLALVPFLFLFVLFAEPMIRVIYGGRFLDAVVLLQLFGLLSLVTPLNSVASNTLLGLGYARIGFYLSLQLLVSSILLYAVCVPLWGALGATLAYLTASILLTWITARELCRYVPLTLKEVLIRTHDVQRFIRSRLVK